MSTSKVRWMTVIIALIALASVWPAAAQLPTMA